MTDLLTSTGVGPTDWPVRCPVDSRWLTARDAECPDCGSSTAPLWALNAFASRLLDHAGSSGNRDEAVSLVDDAASLVPSTEPFEIAAADALQRAGCDDIAALHLEAALALAPRRGDIRDRLDALRSEPARTRVVAQPGRRLSPAWLTAGALAVLVGGVALGVAVAPRDVEGVALASPSATFEPEASNASAVETPSASSRPQPSPAPILPVSTPAAPGPVELVRKALDGDGRLSALDLAVEQIEDGLRISGPVPGPRVAATVATLAAAAAPGSTIDVRGLTFPKPRFVYVQSGDTLWSIAARVYGDPGRWRDLKSANHHLRPIRLAVGTRLIVPD